MSTLATPARPRAKSPIGTKNEATERADPPAPVSGAPWGNAVGGVVVGAEEVMGPLVVVTTEGDVVEVVDVVDVVDVVEVVEDVVDVVEVVEDVANVVEVVEDVANVVEVAEDVANVVVVDEAKRHVGTVTELSSIVTAPVIA
jgi:hypothetical protein